MKTRVLRILCLSLLPLGATALAESPARTIAIAEREDAPKCRKKNVVTRKKFKMIECVTANDIIALRMEGVDGTVDEFHHDADGRQTGVTVKYKGKVFRLDEKKRGEYRVAGLPPLDFVQDWDGTFLGFRAGNEMALEHRRDDKKRLIGSIIASRLTLTVTRPTQKTAHLLLERPDGKVLHDATVEATHEPRRRQRERIRLDLLKDARVQRPLRLKWNSTGSVAEVLDAQGATMYYVHNYGAASVVYDTKNRPLLLDVEEIRTEDGRPTDAIFFSRVIVAANGDIEVLAPITPVGGIFAVRALKSPSGGIEWEVDVAARRESKNVVSHGVSGQVYLCDVLITCAFWESGRACWTTYYWCPDENSGPDCQACEGDPGSGDDPESQYNNRIGNPMLHLKVEDAITGALERLASETCRDVFKQFKTQDGQPLSDVLASINSDPDQWLRSVIIFQDGSNEAPCQQSGVVAYTSPGSSVVRICAAFRNLTYAVAERRIIHEELHSVGVAENPPVQGAPTDAEIDDAIQTGCG